MTEPVLCEAGYYCDVVIDASMAGITSSSKLGTIIQKFCGLKYYSSQEGILRQDQCELCPRGYFCNLVNLDIIADNKKCSAGTVLLIFIYDYCISL
jgi:hypothetical protein